MNNSERSDWVNNDEGLYCWWKSSKLPLGKFLKENREEIDVVINNVLGNRKPAHYLRYGGNR